MPEPEKQADRSKAQGCVPERVCDPLPMHEHGKPASCECQSVRYLAINHVDERPNGYAPIRRLSATSTVRIDAHEEQPNSEHKDSHRREVHRTSIHLITWAVSWEPHNSRIDLNREQLVPRA